ncbi:MAG TPA: WYL domain-containing protein [Marmoricola sp.]|nr:WYL domain-containing protein [Marmoricola sp.]
MTSGGRDQREPMERLVRLASVLHHAGSRGVAAPNLLDVAGWSDAKDGISALKRDFRYLSDLGWQIENIAESGLGAVYRMTTVDNRLRVKLSPEQQTALRRAAILANREELADRLGLTGAHRPRELAAEVHASTDDPAYRTVVEALRRRSLLRFRYGGKDRVVHPAFARTQSTQWYLHGREDGDDTVKAFVISRMQDVRADAPGTADRTDAPRHARLHPMSWEVDPPVDVTLRAPADYAPDVRRWLGAPQQEHQDGDEVELTYRVTNRAALRARVYQLGTRVSVLGPDDVRQEILDELSFMAGE